MAKRRRNWGGERKKPLTVEPRYIYNQVPRDRQNLLSITTRGFVISQYFSIHFPNTRDKKIVRYTEDFVT